MLRNFTGSTGARAVIAVLMLLFVVACSSGDGNLKRERDEARAAAEAAEQARLAAEAAAAAAAEQAKKDAEEAAAAAAEAAQKAAEEAAAQARQEVIAQQERQSVMTAIAAAQAAVAALMDDSSDVDVAAASSAVASASAAIAAATTFSADDTAMYTSQVTMVASSLATAQANIRAYRAEMAAQDAMNQATASARAKQAVDEAIAALAAADEAEAMSTATYTAAAAALSAAQTAVANADADTLAEASALLAEALIQASAAAADLGVKTQAVADATTALEAARATLAEVDPTHVALLAANAALDAAKTEAQNQADAIKALQQQIADLQKAEQDRMTAAEMAAEEARKKEMAAAGKALKKALGDAPLDNLGADDDPATRATISGSNLSVGIPDPANIADPQTAFISSPNMRAGDSAGALGSWAGKHYAHTNTGTKVSNSAIVYTNQGAPTVKPFATSATTPGTTTAVTTVTGDPTNANEYRASTRTLRVAAGTSASASTRDIAGPMFPTAGITTYTPTSPSTEIILAGTYQGAQGQYRCTGANPCTAEAGSSGAVSLTGDWDFIHASGATTSKPDANYLFFGWWLTEDKDGPTSASAFTGVAGTIAPYADATTANFPASGTATYAGHAAGKFAIDSPLGGSDAGHFTADATLTARFSGSASGVSGTLDNFMANEQAVPWSVSLNRAPWNHTPTAGVFESATAVPNAADRTIWSIDGNSAGESGSWSGQAYDEKPGTGSGGDGSNVPTTLIGTFHSEFGSTHTMVGAFGATKE